MSLLKDNIAALEISDELKKDILELFSSVEAKEKEVEDLRKKVPTNSQKVVESVDYEKFTQATDELAAMKSDLAKKLETEPSKAGGHILAAFSMFFE